MVLVVQHASLGCTTTRRVLRLTLIPALGIAIVLLRAKAVADRGCRLELDMASYINMSRRLVRWMNRIRLPLTALRMRYVRLIHAYHVLDESCKWQVMNGWCTE